MNADEQGLDLRHLQSLYDRHRFLDLYALTSRYWTKATDVSALPVEALILAGRSADRLGGPRLSRWLFREAFRRAPADPRVRYFTHHLNPRRASLLQELEDFLAAPDIGGDDPVVRATWYASFSFMWANLRDFDRAHAGLRAAHSIAPDDGYILHLESFVHGLADRWTDALRSAERALEINPGAPYTVLGLGTALINLGRVEESAARLLAIAESCQSYQIVVLACWHLCALAETLDGEARRSALDRARKLAGRLPDLMPLADRESLRIVACTNLDIARLADDYAGIERWSAEVQSPFHRQLLANLARNTEGKRLRLPFRRTIQKYNACVPASLAAAMSAGGMHLSPDEMAAEITFGGTPEWAAADWLRARGYHVRGFFATPDVARSLIRDRIAFVVFWDADESGHAVAVVGFDERSETLLVHDPNSFRGDEYLLTVLDPQASPVGVRGLAVVPAEEGAKLDALLPPESAVVEGAHEQAKQLRLHGPSASRQVVLDLLERFPSHPGTQFLDAVQALEDGQAGQALGKLKALLRRFPASPTVRVSYLNACHALRDRALSGQALKDIVEAGRLPGLDAQQDWIYPPARYVYEYADFLRLSSDTCPRAESLLLGLLRRVPTSAGAWHDLADLLVQKNDRTGALLGYRISSCLAENDEHYARAYADALAADRREEEGLLWLESRARRFRNAPHAVDTWITWISALEDRGHPERALSALDEALAQQGTSAVLLSFAVPFLARMGDWARAEAELERLRNAGLPHAFFEASTRLHQMRGDPEAAAQAAAAWAAELPRSTDARRILLDVIAVRDGPDAAVRLSRQWMLENRDHEEFEEAYCAQLDRVSAPKGKKYAVLLRRLKRNPDDGWAWCELTFDVLFEYELAGEPKRKRLEPRITRFLAECERTSGGTVFALRAQARWAEVRGDWAAAVARSLGSIALDPETFYSYRRAWDCAARLPAAEREELWRRMEPLFIRSTGRLAIARDVMALIAERFGVAAAEKTVESWRAARPDDPDILEAAADLLIDHGHGRSDAARAVALLEPAVRRYPYHSGLRYSLAKGYHFAGRDADAEAVLVEIARRHPDSTSAKSNLATIRNRQGDEAGAYAFLDQAAASAPQDAELVDTRAQILIHRARFDEAVREIENGLGRWPRDVRWRERAVALLTECGAADKAIQAARGGVEACPESAYLWLVLGRALNERRQYAEVGEIESCLRRSLALNGSLYEAADLLAVLLTEQRQYDDASKILLDVETRLTDPSAARGRLAWIRRQRGEKDEAIRDMADVVAAFPWYAWGWSTLMEMLEGDAASDRTRDLLRDIPPPLFTNTHFRVYRLLVLEKAKTEGTQLDEEWGGLLRDYPENAQLHNLRYDVLTEASRWTDAAAVLEAIEPAAPNDPFVLARRCELLSHGKNKDAARRVALRVCFLPGEEFPWPADKVWDVARNGTFARELSVDLRQRLRAGDKPTLQSFAGLAAFAMRKARKHDVRTAFSARFPLGGARELARLLREVSAAPWDGSPYRAIIYTQLNDYGHHRLVADLSGTIEAAAVTSAEEWAQIGRALTAAHFHARARRHYGAWRERTGVSMWMVANYILSLSRRRGDQLLERYNSARDALAGLPHDHCAKYLAHVQADASALLGHKEDFLETWTSYARYFDGRLEDGEFFGPKDRYLLGSVPKLADDQKFFPERDLRGQARKLRLLRRGAPKDKGLSEAHGRTNWLWYILVAIFFSTVMRNISIKPDADYTSVSPSLSGSRAWRTPPPAGGGTAGGPAASSSFSLAMTDRDLTARVTRWSSTDGSYGARVEVTNRGTKTYHFVIVKVEFFDKANRLVGTLMTEARREDYVLPGSSRVFIVRQTGKLDFETASASVVYSAEAK